MAHMDYSVSEAGLQQGINIELLPNIAIVAACCHIYSSILYRFT